MTTTLDAPPQAGPLLAYLLPPPCPAPAPEPDAPAPKPFDRLCLTPRGVTVYSKSGATYDVALGRVGIPTHCTCPGWGFNEHCRHADEALRKFGGFFAAFPGVQPITDAGADAARRGACRECGAALRSTWLYVETRGYLLYYVCEGAGCAFLEGVQ